MSREIYLPDISTNSPYLLARWLLMLSYLYYNRNLSLIDDADYDRMANQVADCWDDLDPHERSLLGDDPDAVRASGQGFAFPARVVSMAVTLARDLGHEIEHEEFEPHGVCECGSKRCPPEGTRVMLVTG